MKNGRFGFFNTPLEGLWATYNVHLRLIRRCIVYFLLVLTKLFLLGVMAECISSEYRLRISIFAPMGSV